MRPNIDELRRLNQDELLALKTLMLEKNAYGQEGEPNIPPPEFFVVCSLLEYPQKLNVEDEALHNEDHNLNSDVVIDGAWYCAKVIVFNVLFGALFVAPLVYLAIRYR